MALLARAATLCRLALRTPWAAARLLSSAAGGELPAEDKPRRRDDSEALRQARALRPPSDRTPPALPEHALRPPAARPVPTSPEVGFSAPRPTHEQRQLNKALTTCASVDDVLNLVTARWALMNCVTVSTALSVIGRLAGKQEPSLWLKDDKRFRQLMRGALSLMERQEMDAQGFSNMLYACGQLGIAPPKSWLRVYWERSAAVIEAFVPQALSNMLYACGQLGVTPPDEWLGRYWHASASKLGDYDPQAYSNTLYASGLLDTRPPADWLERYWHASALKLGGFKPQELSNTIYACGQLGTTPPDYWLERFWHASAAMFGDYDPQAYSNTLYACAQLGITPPAVWLTRFWHASALILAEFKEQNFSNTIYACGQLGITPPDDWLERFWHASALKLEESNPQNFSNTLHACGLLDTRPLAGWLERFSNACEQALPRMSQQTLANIALAMAMLQLWELPLWPSLWERLCSSLSRDIAGWSAEDQLHANQLYQAYQAAAMERPGLLLAPSPQLLAAVRKSWIGGLDTDAERNSRLHDAVSASLKRMGVLHANERWCERAERSIDIAIMGATPIALEVDGPSHFLQDGRPDGSTLLRNRMLAGNGWRVVAVDYRDWEGLTDHAQQEQYLRRLLA